MSHVPAMPARGERIVLASRREEEVLAGAVFLPRTSAPARLCMNEDVRKIAVSVLLGALQCADAVRRGVFTCPRRGAGGSEERTTRTSGRFGSRINASRAAGSGGC